MTLRKRPRYRKDYFFDSATSRDSLGEYIDCPEGGEHLVIEDDEGRRLAYCYQHNVACFVGKGWELEKAKKVKMEQGILTLEKWIWDDLDFDKMGWHDVRIHGIGRYEKVEREEKEGSEKHFSGTDLLLDIDYILKWVTSDPKHWKFWVAPSTLVFENVVEFQMKPVGGTLDWAIGDIVREKAQYPNGSDCWKWQIYWTGMEFLASGYKQYIRQKPVLTRFQYLTWEERSGTSFSKQTWESKT